MSIYLLQTKKSKNADMTVYKLGHTVGNKTNGYARGSELILYFQCINSDSKTVYDIIKREFIQTFKLRKDLEGGTENFEGDLELMRNHILDIIWKFDTGVVPMDLG